MAVRRRRRICPFSENANATGGSRAAANCQGYGTAPGENEASSVRSPTFEELSMSETPDPTASTSAAFDRRAFIGLSAGAAAASTVVPAFAQGTADFGRPHPPIVAPNDPSIRVLGVKLTRPDATIDAYAAGPPTIAPTTPCIVMVHHIWGVDATIRDDVRRYAQAGYLCIAPNLFARSNVPSGGATSDIDTFRPAAAALNDDVVAGDLLAAHAWLAGQAPSAKIGITGFCMGGGIALRQLIGTTDYTAASIFYGDVRPGMSRTARTTPQTFAYATQIHAAIRGNYGQRDTSIAAADVRKLFAVLPTPHELSIYPKAGHAFFDDTRSSYVPGAAADAWTKTLAWFGTYLS
jgi:carboxymethylenebutenolidase